VKDRSTSTEPIAVIGMGCRYPGAATPRMLWTQILARRQAFRRLPDCRLPLSDYHDPNPKTPDKTYGTRAAVIDGFRFDWQKRRIPKSTVESTDIVHWLALEVAMDALNDAGYTPDALPRERTRVIVGNSLTGEQQRAATMRVRWPFIERAIRAAAKSRNLPHGTVQAVIESAEMHFKSVFPPIDEDTLAGSLSNTIAGRICNFLDLKGGGYTVDGACSSSLLAIATAADALILGDVDLAFAGGVDVSLDTFELIGFAKAGALTATEMRVYDRRASGFIPGEGCGFVVLKRLSDAQRDHDYVYATLRGWGVSSDGKGGITAPAVAGQTMALNRAYERAGYSPHTLDFVEGHGTGTRVGDQVELEAIMRSMESFGTPQARACGMTSFKSLVGHTKAAAGIGGFIKAVMAVNRRVLPPTAGCDEAHPIFDSKAQALYPIMHGEVRNVENRLRAGISAMGFGGINTHATVESADPPSQRLEPELTERALLASHQRTELVLLSGASVDELRERMREVQLLVRGVSLAELADLCVHLARGLDEEAPYRAALLAESPEGLVDLLQTAEGHLIESDLQRGQVFISVCRCIWLSNTHAHGQVGFLFPGQGSQQLAAARRIWQRFEWAQKLVADAEKWLAEIGAPSVAERLFVPVERARNAEELRAWQAELTRTEIAQPAICLVSLLWLTYLEQLGVQATVVAGHSLGELSALYAARQITAKELIQVSALRGRAMASCPAGGMASLRASELDTAGLIAEFQSELVIANKNSPKQTVISGNEQALEQVLALAKTRNIPATRLRVAGAFHSPLMAEAAQSMRLQHELQRPLGEPVGALVLSCMTGREISVNTRLSDHLADQILSSVDFVAVANQICDRTDLLIEVGPGQVLCGLVHACRPERLILPVEGQTNSDTDLNAMAASLFVHGVHFHPLKLWDERCIQPFIPAEERRFIENPCERPFQVTQAAQTPDSAVQGEAMLPPQVEDKLSLSTGLSPALLRDYLLQRGEFLADFIRLDLEYEPLQSDQGAVAPSLNAQEAKPQTQPAESPKVARAPGAQGTVAARARLLELVAQRTGFPIESLSLEMNMLDDLHLDSIKTSELVTEVARHLGVEGSIDPMSFSQSTLGAIADALEGVWKNMGQPTLAPPPPRAAATPEGPRSSQVRRVVPAQRWVRNFGVEYVALHNQTTLTQDNSRLLFSNATFAILGRETRSARPLCDLLEQRLGELGIASSEVTSPTLTHLVLVINGEKFEKQASAEEALRQVIEPYFTMVQALRQQGDLRAVMIVDVSAEHEMHRSLWDSASHAWAATLHLEQPKLRVRCLRVPSAAFFKEHLDQLLSELISEENFISLTYDVEGKRYRPQVVAHNRARYSARKQRIGVTDVVVVSGGAKGITAECALHLGKATMARFVLLGSSPHPDDTTAPPERTAAVLRTLERFRDAGIDARYVRCDISNQADVTAVLGQIQDEVGPITVVIHGAGKNEPRRVEHTTQERVQSELGPKLLGAHHLMAALEATPPKMFIALTSIIGVSGMPGNAWYGLSNEVLDRMLGRFGARHRESSVLSIAFSVWDEVGMGAELGSVKRLAELGIEAIHPDEGAERFVELALKDAGHRQVVVTARLQGLDTWPSAHVELPMARHFLQQVLYFEPGVELVCRAHLSTRADPYLLDHNFRGSLLFPTVFGLEAMAEATSYLLGRNSLDVVTIENIELERPIVVNPDRGLTLEIRAQVVESNEPTTRVRVEIMTEQTGFQRAHFSALFTLENSLRHEKASAFEPHVLSIVPERDLYGSLLFQGKRFQRIDRIHKLNSTVCIFSARQAQHEWLLGDPYFHDALLQSVQLCVTPDVCLPIRIQRWALAGPPTQRGNSESSLKTSERLLQASATIENFVSDVYQTKVQAFDEQGHCMISIEGYDARKIERRTEWPTAEQLAADDSEATGININELDEHDVSSVLRTVAEKFGVELPHYRLYRVAGLHNFPKKERHELERPLLVEVVKELSPVMEMPVPIIAWHKEGRPYVENRPELGISLSHDALFCLCSVGEGPQGCDLALLEGRSRADWRALLGADGDALLTAMVDRGLTADEAGTLIWAAAETAKKAYSVALKGVELIGIHENAGLFRVKEHAALIVSSRVAMRHVLALTCQAAHQPFLEERTAVR